MGKCTRLSRVLEHHEQASVSLEQRRMLESAEARPHHRQEIINKIMKELYLVQKVLLAMGRSVQSLLIDGPEFTPADRDLVVRTLLMRQHHPMKPMFTKAFTYLYLGSLPRRHASLEIVHPDRGPSTSALEESAGSVKEPVKIKKKTNKIAKQRNENTARPSAGDQRSIWRNIRAHAGLLKPYQDFARKDVVAGKAKLNADKPAKLSQKNTARCTVIVPNHRVSTASNRREHANFATAMIIVLKKGWAYRRR
ncbi:uncharacterized protein SCHCODRAFT_02602207 [Schizophyllum commune H4-8]|uniref:Uncharacterized protein n=1 Tax=Schizophyllum commune (strain H4-8 / FGSC 9210) TaxID=578458 RepID=D8QEX0_SCHCM|nr:uncharacterized protein SCHCODRAFT_02602207 [Schizophyllum commune H4-8]KAI5888889.1 hypothetical protein SCHCODRAFT_02602207 [Schizophyllum commune H4-8]